MRFGSVCSGIEAASVAWHPLGWRASFVSEIERFPCELLRQRWPDTPLHGDFTTIEADQYAAIDLLVGGTPCQDFSVAGLRAGMAGDRGNLTLQFLTLAGRLRPQWLVWENVPGVLSSNGGRDFGSFLGGLGELGYGWAYRTLDAQHFGVPQRRRRVFVVGYSGDWRRAAAVLFERHCLQGHSSPRRQAREGIAPTISARPTGGGGLGTDFDCDGGLIPIDMRQASRGEKLTNNRAHGSGGAPGHGVGEPGDPGFTVSERGQAIAYAIQERATCENPDAGPDGAGWRGDGNAYTLEARTVPQAVALRGREGGATAELSDVPSALRAGGGGGGDKAHVLTGAVRRLTPRECERLQGFEDDYTLIQYRGKPAADGPRYKALGNSMAVPVMHWIGQRIERVQGISP